MKIAIYGAGKAAKFFTENLKNNEEVVYYLETSPTKKEYLGKKVISPEEMDVDEFDVLFIAAWNDNIIKHLEITPDKNGKYLDKDRIIFYSDYLNPSWKKSKEIMPYTSVLVNDNIVFITDSNDDCMPTVMMELKETYSKLYIDTFFELLEKYYDSSGKYFLDIGANIGTTSVYVKKVLNKELKVIAFEPLKENYDLLRINCILNEVEDIICENIGLSNENGSAKFEKRLHQSGGGHLVKEEIPETNYKMVKIQTLDNYIDVGGYEAEEIMALWIDVEGFEPEVIDGAMKTLLTKKIPIMQEFNPEFYKRFNVHEKYYENMCKIYKGFIDVRAYANGNKEEYPICKLEEWLETKRNNGTDLFFF